MEDKLHIANSQIVFSFKRNAAIRKRIFDFEDALKGEFKTPFKSHAIPDDMDSNITRFESNSINGFSRLQVNQNRVTLLTTYSEEFKTDYAKVKKYVENKLDMIYSLVKSEEMEFVAMIIEIGVYMDQNLLNDFIRENTGALAVKDDCRDFSLYYSKEFKDDYFLNIKCSKFTEQRFEKDGGSSTLTPSGETKYGVNALLDINTKPSYSKKGSYDEKLMECLKNDTFDIISNLKMKDFLTGNI